MQKSDHYDIAIIGTGITGLSTAHHLASAPHLRICLSEGADRKAVTDSSAQMITGGLIDNFTRISQRHGFEHAKESWLYSNHAYDALLAYAQKSGITVTKGTRHRLIETEDEWAECGKAVEQLKRADFASEITKSLPEGSAVLVGQQIDEPCAATIDKKQLLQSLRNATQALDRIGETLSIVKDSQHFKITSADREITAEVVILANHLGIPKFLPGLGAVLVSTQDQYLRIKTDGKTLPFPVGSALTWRHGHYWASVESPTQICMGGARFLRPLAGFEAKAPELSPKISAHLPEAWAKYFPHIPLKEVVDQKAGLDIRPCDEIPVIGPMYGETGMFLAAGYMGQGLSLGFKAGQSLANIVLGKSDELPRFFWPERHRSLAATSD